MSRRGLFATLAAGQRRSERDAARRYRAMLVQQRQIDQMTMQARAAYDVQLYENHLDFVVSLHRDASAPWDWRQVVNAPPPAPVHHREQAARQAVQAYRPSIGDRLLGGAATQLHALEAAIATARAEDEAETRHHAAQWDWCRQIAHGVLQNDLRAFAAAVEHLCPFEELEAAGMTVQFRTQEPWYAEAFVAVRNDVVPKEEKKLLASGKLAAKEMPKAKYWTHYQDYVCGAALRASRELFHLLPVGKVYVNVATTMLDTATGHDRARTILSVEFEREPFLRLNFERIDASDAVSGFRHAMSFKKTTGFAAVEPLAPLASLTSR